MRRQAERLWWRLEDVKVKMMRSGFCASRQDVEREAELTVEVAGVVLGLQLRDELGFLPQQAVPVQVLEELVLLDLGRPACTSDKRTQVKVDGETLHRRSKKVEGAESTPAQSASVSAAVNCDATGRVDS